MCNSNTSTEMEIYYLLLLPCLLIPRFFIDPTDELKFMLVVIELEYTEHHSLLCRPIRVPMLTPVHCRERQQWACEYQNWTTKQWRKVAWSDEVPFLLHQIDGHHFSREYLLPCTMGGRKASRGRVMFWGLFCWETKSNGESAAIYVDAT